MECSSRTIRLEKACMKQVVSEYTYINDCQAIVTEARKKITEILIDSKHLFNFRSLRLLASSCELYQYQIGVFLAIELEK